MNGTPSKIEAGFSRPRSGAGEARHHAVRRAPIERAAATREKVMKLAWVADAGLSIRQVET